MGSETMETDRRKEVINACLNLFVERGLYKTSTRDLSKALSLQSGGLYYYFQTKDDAVIACVEAAITKLEETLIVPVKKEIFEPTTMMNKLLSRAEAMAPVMKFVVTVCADKQYEEKTKPILDSLGKRYIYYTEVFADLLNCKSQEINPFVYMCITSITNYMIFGEESFIASQIKAIQLKLERILESKKETQMGVSL